MDHGWNGTGECRCCVPVFLCFPLFLVSRRQIAGSSVSVSLCLFLSPFCSRSTPGRLEIIVARPTGGAQMINRTRGTFRPHTSPPLKNPIACFSRAVTGSLSRIACDRCVSPRDGQECRSLVVVSVTLMKRSRLSLPRPREKRPQNQEAQLAKDQPHERRGGGGGKSGDSVSGSDSRKQVYGTAVDISPVSKVGVLRSGYVLRSKDVNRCPTK